MQITLTSDEVSHAIACYLRANAAVVVGEINYSLKKTGLVAEVETTVIDSPLPEAVAEELREVTPAPMPTRGDTFVEVYGGQVEPEEHTPDPEELIDETPKETVQETEPVVVKRTETTEQRMMREADEEVSASELENNIAAVELAETFPVSEDVLTEGHDEDVVTPVEPLTFEFGAIVSPTVVEEMPVPDAISIADILGSPGN